MRVKPAISILAAAFLLHSVCGCATPTKAKGYATVPTTILQNTQVCREENERGIDLANAGRLAEAEKAFRQALQNDVSYAAAHNNLGLVLLQSKRYYEAAVEFRFASKLDRSAVEPVVNLGRLYDTIGWQAAAAKQYEEAHRIEPGGAKMSSAVNRRIETGEK